MAHDEHYQTNVANNLLSYKEVNISYLFNNSEDNISNLLSQLSSENRLDEYGCPLPEGYYKDLTQIPAILATLIVIYVVVIVLAICGNMLVIWTVWKNNHMHTVTNYYIVNLAVSDLLVSAIVTPLKLLEFTAPCRWNIFRSDGLCSFMSYFQPVFVFASVLTLVAISMERYSVLFYYHSQYKLMITWTYTCTSKIAKKQSSSTAYFKSNERGFWSSYFSFYLTTFKESIYLLDVTGFDTHVFTMYFCLYIIYLFWKKWRKCDKIVIVKVLFVNRTFWNS